MFKKIDFTLNGNHYTGMLLRSANLNESVAIYLIEKQTQLPERPELQDPFICCVQELINETPVTRDWHTASTLKNCLKHYLDMLCRYA